MVEKYKNLIEFSKNLKVSEFEKEFDKLLDDGDDIDICILSKVLENYPEVSTSSDITKEILDIRKNNIEKINKIIDIIISESFIVDSSLLLKKHDEVIKFSRVYDLIGWDYTDLISGNTILHSQISGLHVEGVKFIIEKEKNKIYCGTDKINGNGNTPLESLFLEKHEAYSESSAYEKKEEIFYILMNLKSNDNFELKFNLLKKVFIYKIKNKNLCINDIKIIAENRFLSFLDMNLIKSVVDNIQPKNNKEKRHLNILFSSCLKLN